MLPPTSSLLRSRPLALRPCHIIRPQRLYNPSRYYSLPHDPPPSKSPSQGDPTKPDLKLDTRPQITDLPQNDTQPPSISIDAPSERSTPDANKLESGTQVSSAANEDRLAELRETLRIWTESTAATIRRRADDYTTQAIKTFSQLGRELNNVTGYGEIELLKKRVVEQERKIGAARQASRDAKEDYDKAVHQRANSQREVNDLLQRKSHWTDEDVSRFTALVRKDHLFEQEEARTKANAALTESGVEREFSELMRVILNRYHEEQIWSDKIRSASTYGSLTVLGLNVLVFILALVFVEPWKRKRLTQTFERKVEDLGADTMAAFDGRTKELVERLDTQDGLLTQMMEMVHYANQPADIMSQSTRDSENEEGIPSPKPTAPSLSIIHTWTPELSWVVAASATTAGLLGWFARSWYGR